MPIDAQHSHRGERQQMEAIVIQAGGPPAQSLAYRCEPVPEPGPGEVLVEVHAAGVNPIDVANAAGLLGAPPMIPGVDFAGIVVSDGDHAGQEVWGSGPALGIRRPGTHARFVALPETWLSRKPDRLTMTEAAAIGRSHLAAWETVINAMDLEPGETILITGGAGMVGQAATAIARWRGAEPIVADRHRPGGVEHFIDTGSSDLREAVLELTDGRGADAVLDTIGGPLFEAAFAACGSTVGWSEFSARPNRGSTSPWPRSTTGSCTSRDSPAFSWTGPTSRASSTNSARCSTAAPSSPRPSRRGPSRTAPRPTRRC